MMNPYKTLAQASVEIPSIQSTSNQRREVGMSQTMRTSGIFDSLGKFVTPQGLIPVHERRQTRVQLLFRQLHEVLE